MTASLDRQRAIGEAAEWLSLQSSPPSPVVSVLRERFGLTPLEACHATKAAAVLRQGRHL